MKLNDDGTELEMTECLHEALISVMREFVNLQRAQGGYPDAWHWGRCYVADNVCSNKPFRFQYGEAGDEPDSRGQFAVLLETEDE